MVEAVIVDRSPGNMRGYTWLSKSDEHQPREKHNTGSYALGGGAHRIPSLSRSFGGAYSLTTAALLKSLPIRLFDFSRLPFILPHY
jgi:hypothetical protein